MNLEKLVPLEVHSRVKNGKITMKSFSMLEWGLPYTIGKLKRRAFQQAKDTPIGYLVKEIRPWEVPGLKVENSRECPGATHDHKGAGEVLQRATEAYVWGNVSEWRREAVTSSL